MLNLTMSASLEVTSGFTLNTDQLNTGVLGYLETPITAPIRSASWSRGRDSMLASFSAGSCTIVFDNRDRLLDPANTSSALYGELYPGRRLTLFMSQDSATNRVFSGFVDSWTYDYSLSDDATVTVTVLDAFSYFANLTIPSLSVPEETSGARMTRILSYIEWPVSLRSIDTGYSTLAAETITNANVLEYMGKIAQSEFGMFFMDATGLVKFRQRNRVNTFSPLVIENVTDKYIEDVQFDYSFDRVFNYATLQNTAVGVSASAQNSTSITKYGRRPESFDVLISSSTQMQSLVSGLVSLYGEPDFIVREASVNLDAVQFIVSGEIGMNTAGNVVVAVSNLDIGYLTQVLWEPPGSTPGVDRIDIPALMITGIEYQVAPGSYHVRVQLDYALGYDSMILNDPVQGRLDYGKLGV